MMVAIQHLKICKEVVGPTIILRDRFIRFLVVIVVTVVSVAAIVLIHLNAAPRADAIVQSTERNVIVRLEIS